MLFQANQGWVDACIAIKGRELQQFQQKIKA